MKDASRKMKNKNSEQSRHIFRQGIKNNEPWQKITGFYIMNSVVGNSNRSLSEFWKEITKKLPSQLSKTP